MGEQKALFDLLSEAMRFKEVLVRIVGVSAVMLDFEDMFAQSLTGTQPCP